MKSIQLLIIKAKELQKEIVAQGRVYLSQIKNFSFAYLLDVLIQKGTSSVKDFYVKNFKWTEGLVSAAKLVGLGANVLMYASVFI
jgi:hypothetical protein